MGSNVVLPKEKSKIITSRENNEIYRKLSGLENSVVLGPSGDEVSVNSRRINSKQNKNNDDYFNLRPNYSSNNYFSKDSISLNEEVDIGSIMDTFVSTYNGHLETTKSTNTSHAVNRAIVEFRTAIRNLKKLNVSNEKIMEIFNLEEIDMIHDSIMTARSYIVNHKVKSN